MKPLPAHVRHLTTTRDNRLPAERVERTGPITIPPPPDELDEQAHRYWNQYAETLIRMGVDVANYQQALFMLSAVTAEYHRAEQMSRQYQKDPNVKPSSIWTMISWCRSTEKQMNTLLASFGLTPAGNVKVRG